MHRVNQKRRQAAILRFIAYGVIIALSVVTTVVLLYVALGYRLDRRSGHVVRSGLLLVNSKPEAAAVYIGNEQKVDATPGRLVLSAGSYDLALKADGYRDWSKRVQVAASSVREVNYPLLIPTTLSPRQVISSMGTPTLVSQSQDRKNLVTFTNDQSVLKLTVLDPQEPKQTDLPLGAMFTKENGQLGTLKVIEWALNNKQLLFEHTLPSGKVELISFDITKPEGAVNITNLYSDQQITDIHYLGGEAKFVYGLTGTTLKLYRLSEAESETVLQNVVSYQPYGDDTVMFTRSAANNMNEVGIWQDKVVTVIESSVDSAIKPELSYARYDDHYYFVIAYTNGKKVTIYRDPLKKPILAKQLPFLTLEFDAPQRLKFSDSAQFFTVQNGNRMLTYDFEDKLQYQTTLPFELAPDTALTWADSNHLQATAADGTVYLFEYDGQNQQALVPTRSGTRLYFAPNYQYTYRLFDGDAGARLEVVSLVSGKQ